ncbi:hypothetical protein KIL84_008694 [Mauremys mutica]|uniref:Uncharacterized protein n=1 Tax=Mauremys mutica TaxID=74926 RepID=A0A9D4AXZ7_9SAUR|nr:hypothetical protein KIL84_008694 [Mauremys mutica]
MAKGAIAQGPGCGAWLQPSLHQSNLSHPFLGGPLTGLAVDGPVLGQETTQDTCSSDSVGVTSIRTGGLEPRSVEPGTTDAPTVLPGGHTKPDPRSTVEIRCPKGPERQHLVAT